MRRLTRQPTPVGHDVVIVAGRAAGYPLQIAAWLGADEAFSELVALAFDP